MRGVKARRGAVQLCTAPLRLFRMRYATLKGLDTEALFVQVGLVVITFSEEGSYAHLYQ